MRTILKTKTILALLLSMTMLLPTEVAVYAEEINANQNSIVEQSESSEDIQGDKAEDISEEVEGISEAEEMEEGKEESKS